MTRTEPAGSMERHAGVENAYLNYDDLTAEDRLTLVWALTWPCLLYDALLQIAQTAFGLEDLGRILFPAALAGLFILAPWTIRRVVGLNYPKFHLAVIGHDGSKARLMTYKESLSVAWLFLVRYTGCYLAVIALYCLIQLGNGKFPNAFEDLKRLPVHSSPAAAFLKFAADEVVSFTLLYFWIVRAATRKVYAEFVLRLERTAAPVSKADWPVTGETGI